MSKPENLSSFNKVSTAVVQAGLRCLDSMESLKSTLETIQITPENLNEEAFAGILFGVMELQNKLDKDALSHYVQNTLQMNLNSLVKYAKQSPSKLDWVKVVLNFDRPGIIFKNRYDVSVILGAYKFYMNENDFHAIAALWEEWTNKDAQFSFLSYAVVQAPSQMVNLPAISKTKVISPEHLSSLDSIFAAELEKMSECPWVSLELIEVCLKNVSETGSSIANSVFAGGLQKYTTFLFIGLLRLLPYKNIIHEKSFLILFRRFLEGTADTTLGLFYAWLVEPNAFFQEFDLFLQSDFKYVSSVLDLLYGFNLMPVLYFGKIFKFSLPLMTLAHKRKLVNLQYWIEDCFHSSNDNFLKECLPFLRKHCEQLALEAECTGTNQFTYESFAVYFQVLYRLTLNNEQHEELKSIHNLINEKYPQFQNIVLKIVQQGIIFLKFPQDVIVKMKDFFKQLHKGLISIDDAVSTLISALESDDVTKNSFYGAVLTLLIEEFHALDSYPEHELKVTATLIGRLIKTKSLTFCFNRILIACAMNSFQSPYMSNHWKFGVTVIGQIKPIISEITQLKEFFQKQQQLFDEIPDLSKVDPNALNSDDQNENHLQSKEDDKAKAPEPESATKSNITVDNNNSSFGVIKPDTLITSDFNNGLPEPSDEVKERIIFLINNATILNIEEKVEEIKNLLTQPAYNFFCQYLVINRISNEVNNHPTYHALLEKLNNRDINDLILDVTYSKIHILLDSEITSKSASERTLLKSLGTWLGSLTLARNKPILHDKLNLKQVLIKGYKTNRMIVSIPFTSKVLAQGINGQVFKPPNPWLMALLRLLAEITRVPSCKNNLCFEIESLFNKFSIKLNELEPSNLLKEIDLEMEQEMARDETPKFNGKVFDPNNLSQHIILDPSLESAFNFSLKELVERSLIICIQAAMQQASTKILNLCATMTKQLVLKDFAMEPNEDKLLISAQHFGHAVCNAYIHGGFKDSLLQYFITGFMIALGELNLPFNPFAKEEIEHIIFVNFRLAQFIFQIGISKHMDSYIVQYLSDATSLRKRSREINGQPFYDMAKYNSTNYPSNLADILKPKPTGLTTEQMQIYESFSRLKFEMPHEVAISDFYATHCDVDFGFSSVSNSMNYLDNYNDAQVRDIFLRALNEFDRIVGEPSNSRDDSDDPELKQSIIRLNSIISQIPGRDNLIAEFTQKYVNRLFVSNSHFKQRLYVLLLEHVFMNYPKVAVEVKKWLVYSKEENKLKPNATKLLIATKHINLAELDAHLGNLIANRILNVADYCITLMRICLLEEPFVGTFDSFINIREGLITLAKLNNTYPQIQAVLEDIKSQYDMKVQERELENNIQYYYNEWIRLYQNPDTTDAENYDFVVKLLHQRILFEEHIMPVFIKSSVRFTLDRYTEALKSNISTINPYLYIDAMAKMIVAITVYSQNQNDERNAASTGIFTNSLTVLALTLVHNHQTKEERFDPKPFFRLYSSILYNLQAFEQRLKPIENNLILTFSNSLAPLQPEIVPGFAFAWVNIFSHKLFLPKLMSLENNAGWKNAQGLLSHLYRFLNTILPTHYTKAGWEFYQGVVRLTAAIMHDYPEFIIAHHFGLICDVPLACVQLRNLLSTTNYPGFKYPHPTSHFYDGKVNPEFLSAPPVRSDYTMPLERKGLVEGICKYLESREPINFLISLRPKLFKAEDNEQYDHVVINCLVLFVAIKDLETAPPNSTTHRPAAMDIYHQLLLDLDPQGRHIYINALFAQLRYPNLHTCYFSQVILQLFSTATQAFSKEQIIRVMMDKVTAKLPVPWGIWCLVIDLFEDHSYGLREQAFIKKEPGLLSYLEKCVVVNDKEQDE